MNEFVRRLLIGAGSMFLVPAGLLPKPQFRITVIGNTATREIAGDFSRIASDLNRATDAIEHSAQLELSI